MLLANERRILLQQMQDRKKARKATDHGMALPSVSLAVFSTPSPYRWNSKQGRLYSNMTEETHPLENGKFFLRYNTGIIPNNYSNFWICSLPKLDEHWLSERVRVVSLIVVLLCLKDLLNIHGISKVITKYKSLL